MRISPLNVHDNLGSGKPLVPPWPYGKAFAYCALGSRSNACLNVPKQARCPRVYPR